MGGILKVHTKRNKKSMKLTSQYVAIISFHRYVMYKTYNNNNKETFVKANFNYEYIHNVIHLYLLP